MTCSGDPTTGRVFENIKMMKLGLRVSPVTSQVVQECLHHIEMEYPSPLQLGVCGRGTLHRSELTNEETPTGPRKVDTCTWYSG